MSGQKGPVCRKKLVLLYLCLLLLQESFAPEPNPGPRPPKFPCGVCHKAMEWTIPRVQCYSSNIWYHKDCMVMSDQNYMALKNISWECDNSGLPNFYPVFSITLYMKPPTHSPRCNINMTMVSPTTPLLLQTSVSAIQEQPHHQTEKEVYSAPDIVLTSQDCTYHLTRALKITATTSPTLS